MEKISPKTTKEDFLVKFDKKIYPSVKQKNYQPGHSDKKAIVVFTDKADAEKACLELNDKVIDESTWKVTF